MCWASVCVHCRIGSLEVNSLADSSLEEVHCRIGSLEVIPYTNNSRTHVHCRIGSLEETKGDA